MPHNQSSDSRDANACTPSAEGEYQSVWSDIFTPRHMEEFPPEASPRTTDFSPAPLFDADSQIADLEDYPLEANTFPANDLFELCEAHVKPQPDINQKRVTITADGTEIVQHGDKTWTTKLDGTKILEVANGSTRVLYADGTIVRTSPGYKTTELPDGTRVSQSADNETTEFPNGFKVIEIKGNIDLVLSNGTRIFHDGQIWVPRADGGTDVTYPDGRKVTFPA